MIEINNKPNENTTETPKADRLKIQTIQNLSLTLNFKSKRKRNKFLEALARMKELKLFINDFSDDIQQGILEKYWAAIEWIKNPSKEFQIAACTNNPMAIRYIKNPCKEAQIIAVTKDPLTFYTNDNRCEEAQIIAMKGNPFGLESYGRSEKKVKLCEKAQIIAVKRDWRQCRGIENPCEEAIRITKEGAYKTAKQQAEFNKKCKEDSLYYKTAKQQAESDDRDAEYYFKEYCEWIWLPVN